MLLERESIITAMLFSTLVPKEASEVDNDIAEYSDISKDFQ